MVHFYFHTGAGGRRMVRGSVVDEAPHINDFAKDPYKDRIVVGVIIYIFDEKGRTLLFKRKNHPYQGYWEAVGGKVNFLERLEEAAVREAEEEAGIKIKEEDLKFVCVFQHIVKKERYHRVLVVYATKVDSSVHIKLSEHDEYGWFEMNKLPEKFLCGPVEEAYKVVFGEEPCLND